MADFTKQFENDKLAKGTYYCRSRLDGRECLAVIRYDGELYDADYNGTLNKGYWNILDKVPTYEEYQALLSDSLAKNKGVEINAELKAENKKLKEIIKFAIDGIRNITKNHRFTPISTAEILLKELRNKLK